MLSVVKWRANVSIVSVIDSIRHARVINNLAACLFYKDHVC